MHSHILWRHFQTQDMRAHTYGLSLRSKNMCPVAMTPRHRGEQAELRLDREILTNCLMCTPAHCRHASNQWSTPSLPVCVSLSRPLTWQAAVTLLWLFVSRLRSPWAASTAHSKVTENPPSCWKEMKSGTPKSWRTKNDSSTLEHSLLCVNLKMHTEITSGSSSSLTYPETCQRCINVGVYSSRQLMLVVRSSSYTYLLYVDMNALCNARRVI